MSVIEIRVKNTSIPNKFIISWSNTLETSLILDFNPFIERFKLDLNQEFRLLHWQARPKGVRTWGVFYSSGKYKVFHEEWYALGNLNVNLLQLDETKIKTLPTAVLYLREPKLLEDAA